MLWGMPLPGSGRDSCCSPNAPCLALGPPGLCDVPQGHDNTQAPLKVPRDGSKGLGESPSRVVSAGLLQAGAAPGCILVLRADPCDLPRSEAMRSWLPATRQGTQRPLRAGQSHALPERLAARA